MAPTLNFALRMVISAALAATCLDAIKLFNLMMPESYTAPEAPAKTAQFPTGYTPCDFAVQQLMGEMEQCLDDCTADQPNEYYCQDPYGCRQSLIRTVYYVSRVCRGNTDLHPTISNLHDQIVYATSKACPTSPCSCDLESSLVLSMQLLSMNATESRAYQCLPCVKQSFGRHGEVSGKIRCNRVDGQYCNFDSVDAITRDNLCQPCTQRYWAKMVSADDVRGMDSNSAMFIRACYDGGDGNTCYNKVADYLENVHHVVITSEGVFSDPGDFKACARSDTGPSTDCMGVVEALVDGVGCCAPAVPALLLRNFDLPELESMIQDKVGLDATCTELATIFVDITVAAQDTAENVCVAIKQDLVTTVAVLPNLVNCRGVDNPIPEQVTVRATVFGYRAANLPLGSKNNFGIGVAFDPDLLQYPVLEIQMSAIA